MAKDSQQIDLVDSFRLVVLALDGRLTDEETDKWFAKLKFKSYAEQARAYEVSVATIRHTWKPNGMPSVGRRGSGSDINGAATIKWWRTRKKRNDEARGVDEYTERKRDAESRIVEAEARIKERKANVVEGEYLPLSVAVSVVKGYANRLRDGLMGVARRMQPMFPGKYKVQLTEEVDRYHRNLLTAFVETSISDLRQAAKERDSDNGYSAD